MCLGSLGTVARRWDDGGMPMAEVTLDDRTVNACLLYHPDTDVGADVLVHMGFVVDVMDCETAADARALRAELERPPVG
jgi:hydrogenase maturation factor